MQSNPHQLPRTKLQIIVVEVIRSLSWFSVIGPHFRNQLKLETHHRIIWALQDRAAASPWPPLWIILSPHYGSWQVVALLPSVCQVEREEEGLYSVSSPPSARGSPFLHVRAHERVPACVQCCVRVPWRADSAGQMLKYPVTVNRLCIKLLTLLHSAPSGRYRMEWVELHLPVSLALKSLQADVNATSLKESTVPGNGGFYSLQLWHHH